MPGRVDWAECKSSAHARECPFLESPGQHTGSAQKRTGVLLRLFANQVSPGMKADA